MTGPCAILILGLTTGAPTPFDGKWLAEYDPACPGTSPDGHPMTAHITCTDDPAEAMRFADAAEAHATWTKTSGRTRPDGKPDRPLTAFTIAVDLLNPYDKEPSDG